MTLGENEIYPQVLTFFIKPQIWLFHVVVLQTMANKWTKVKNANANLCRSRSCLRCLSSLISGHIFLSLFCTSLKCVLNESPPLPRGRRDGEPGRTIALHFCPTVLFS